MEYAVVKVAGESDIMGKVKLLDDNTIVLEDPMYVIIRQNTSRGLTLAMQRATLLADIHEIELDFSKVMGYYYPAPEVCSYYDECVDAHTTMYDEMFRKQITGEEYTEQSSDLLDTISNMLQSKTSNTVFH
jgi:hypothetical protein